MLVITLQAPPSSVTIVATFLITPSSSSNNPLSLSSNVIRKGMCFLAIATICIG